MHSENKDLYAAILTGAGILLSVLVYFIWTILRQHRRVNRWQNARIAAEIATLENERRRIAADLHDELGPVLSAVKLQVNHLEPSDETDRVILEKSSAQIDEVIRRFREISYDLLPNTLVRKGITRAMEEFVEKIRLPSGLQIQYKGMVGRLDPDKEVNIYRILQEIVHNTVKHARASVLKISIQEKQGVLRIESTDDGIGFQWDDSELKGRGLGLLNLQSRVEVLRGQLHIQTQPGAGTRYIIEIPFS